MRFKVGDRVVLEGKILDIMEGTARIEFEPYQEIWVDLPFKKMKKKPKRIKK